MNPTPADAAAQIRQAPRGSVARTIPTAFSTCHAAATTRGVAASAPYLFTVATWGLSGGDLGTHRRGMTSFDTASATSSPPLARLTLTLGPEGQRAVAQFMAISGVSSRPDAVRELAARLAVAPASVRERLVATPLPPLSGFGSRRLDARIAADDRDALDRWCGDALRAQDAIRAALHLSTTDGSFAAELGLGGKLTVDAPPDSPTSSPTPPQRFSPPPKSTHQHPRPKPEPAAAPAQSSLHRPATRRRPTRRPAHGPFTATRTALTAPWPPTPRAIPAVEVADDWETGILIRRLKSGRADMHFAPAWTDEVEAAVEDLVEILGSGDSITVVAGIQRDTWEERDEDGELVDSGTTWTLVPVPRPKSIAHDMLVSAHAAGGVDLEARVHRVDDEGTTGAIVELVVTGAF
jgi:hypothetical protein